MNRSTVLVPLMLLASNCAKPARVACPAPSAVAPAAIGGAAYVRGLGSRLGYGDEQNVIAEAVAEIHRMDPTMDGDAITNVLIAADCRSRPPRPIRTRPQLPTALPVSAHRWTRFWPSSRES